MRTYSVSLLSVSTVIHQRSSNAPGGPRLTVAVQFSPKMRYRSYDRPARTLKVKDPMTPDSKDRAKPAAVIRSSKYRVALPTPTNDFTSPPRNRIASMEWTDDPMIQVGALTSLRRNSHVI